MKNFKNVNKVIAYVMILVLAMILISGCGGESTNASKGNTQHNIAFYAYNSIPILDWDPSIEFSNGIIVLHNVYETLLRYDPLEDKIIPLLATDYTKSEDGLIWTFNIRKGVKFHDGTDLNAEAVKFSIDRTMKLGKGASFIWEPVKEINVKDDYTVEFVLKYPTALDLITASVYAAFIISPTAVQSNPEGWLTQGNEAGTGPYKLENFKMGEEVVLTKFDDYWQGWEDNKFDKVVIKKIPETATRRQLAEKGEVDITMSLTYEDIAALENCEEVDIVESPSFENLIFFFDTEQKPLDDVLVRKALSYAFPYEEVVNYTMGSYARQSKGCVPYGLWGHGQDIKQYKYDLGKAKELLSQAGYPNGGFKIVLTYMSGDEAEKKAAELYKAELGKLNIEMEIRGMPWESQWEMARNKDPKKRQDIYVMYWWPDVASPHTYLYTLFYNHEDILYNLSYWKNEEFDKLVDEGLKCSGIDRNQAAQKYIQAQELLVEDAVAIFAYDKEYVRVVNKTFKGYKDNPAYPHVVFFYDTYREK